jgi:hypothetical protein
MFLHEASSIGEAAQGGCFPASAFQAGKALLLRRDRLSKGSLELTGICGQTGLELCWKW